MTNTRSIKVDEKTYDAIQEIRQFHYGSKSVPIRETIALLVAIYVQQCGVGVDVNEFPQV